MPDLFVNVDTCVRCGLCAADCPMGVISWEQGGLPRYAEGGAALCVVCGHCEAVCPSGSIQVDDPRLDPRTYPAPTEKIAPEALEGHLRMRRSIRRFKPQPVDRALIERLLEVARYAPSATNAQPLAWTVLADTAEVRRLTAMAMDWLKNLVANDPSHPISFYAPRLLAAWDAGLDPVCRLAPHLLVVHADKNSPTAAKDAFIALTLIDAAAPAFGVGTCWAGFFHLAAQAWPPLRDALALPPGHEPLYAMMLGTPDVTYRRIPRRNRQVVRWR